MKISEFNVAELELITAALFYEVAGESVMLDPSFDHLAKVLERSLVTKVPEYSPDTGQWCLDIIKDDEAEWLEFVDKCSAVMGEHRTIYHTTIWKVLGFED